MREHFRRQSSLGRGSLRPELLSARVASSRSGWRGGHSRGPSSNGHNHYLGAGASSKASGRLICVRFRRYLIPRILIALLLGAVTTVVVSWLIVVLRTPQQDSISSHGHYSNHVVTRFDVYDSILWSATYSWQAMPSVNTGWVFRRSPDLDALPTWSGLLAANWSLRDDYPYVSDHAMLEFASGWPLRAMLSVQLQSSFGDVGHITVSGIPIDPLQGGSIPLSERALPLRILPLGFAVNTALAAVLWWLLLLAFPTTRRFLRHRRCACLRCGYGPLPSPVARCSECGSIRSVRANATPTA